MFVFYICFLVVLESLFSGGSWYYMSWKIYWTWLSTNTYKLFTWFENTVLKQIWNDNTNSIGSLSQEQEEIEPALKIHFVAKEMVFIKLKKCLKATVLYFLSYCCYWHKMNSFYNSSLALVGDRMVIRKKL